MECTKCGASDAVEVVAQGALATAITPEPRCRACLSRAFEGYGLWKAEFERLLRRGVSREVANTELCRRMDAGEPPPILLN